MADERALKQKQMIVAYEDAEQLKPFFEMAAVKGEHKEERESAKRVLRELEMVRDIDYYPMRGHQMFLSSVDHDFLKTVMDHYGMRGKR